MTPVASIAGDDEEGDCFRCCLAAILNVPASFIPHFGSLYRDQNSFHDEVNEWLKQFGLVQGCAVMDGDTPVDKVPEYINNVSPLAPCILSGEHRNGANHSVVVMNGKVYDMTASGLIGPIKGSGYWVTWIATGDNFKIRMI